MSVVVSECAGYHVPGAGPTCCSRSPNGETKPSLLLICPVNRWASLTHRSWEGWELPSHEGRGGERHARRAQIVPLGDVRSSPPATVTQVQAQAGAELRAGQESANPGPGHMWPIAHELSALDILNLYNKIEKKLTENKALCRKGFPGPSSRADHRDSHRVLSEIDGLCVVG